MCVMIVSVSIIFFILEAPVLIFICLMQGSYISQSWPYIRLTWTLMNLMMYTNHVINFFSYCMTGTKFRRELIKLFYMHKAIRFMSVYKNVNLFTSAAAPQDHHRHHHRHNHHRHCSHTHHKPPLASCSNVQLANDENVNNYVDVVNIDDRNAAGIDVILNNVDKDNVKEVNFDFGNVVAANVAGAGGAPGVADPDAVAAVVTVTTAAVKPGLQVITARRALGGSLNDRRRNKVSLKRHILAFNY